MFSLDCENITEENNRTKNLIFLISNLVINKEVGYLSENY
jgi:hypothetical protein